MVRPVYTRASSSSSSLLYFPLKYVPSHRTVFAAGLKRRALGLFKTNSTTALMQKISRENADSEDVMRRVAEIEQEGSKRTHSTGDSTMSSIGGGGSSVAGGGGIAGSALRSGYGQRTYLPASLEPI